MAATIRVLESAALQDIPAMLRRMADDIESGQYGGVIEAAVVLSGDELNVFGLGRADGTVTHYLLGCGMAKLQYPRLRR